MKSNYEWLDQIPIGWEDLVRHMIEECETINPTYAIEDLKEKWGAVRVYSYCKSWYDNNAMETNSEESRAINQIEDKYTLISERTCCKCGKPATKYSTGWILPWCDECGVDEEKYYRRFIAEK